MSGSRVCALQPLKMLPSKVHQVARTYLHQCIVTKTFWHKIVTIVWRQADNTALFWADKQNSFQLHRVKISWYLLCVKLCQWWFLYWLPRTIHIDSTSTFSQSRPSECCISPLLFLWLFGHIPHVNICWEFRRIGRLRYWIIVQVWGLQLGQEIWWGKN